MDVMPESFSGIAAFESYDGTPINYPQQSNNMLIRWKNQNPSDVTPNTPNYAKWGVSEAFPIVAHGFSTLVTTISNGVYIACLIRDYRESDNHDQIICPLTC